jgi:hypothetical protein
MLIALLLYKFMLSLIKFQCPCKCNDGSVLCQSRELGFFEKCEKGTYSEASKGAEEHQSSNIGEPDEDENEAENKGAERNMPKTVETIEIEIFHDEFEPNVNEHSETRGSIKNDSDSDSDSEFEMAFESEI